MSMMRVPFLAADLAEMAADDVLEPSIYQGPAASYGFDESLTAGAHNDPAMGSADRDSLVGSRQEVLGPEDALLAEEGESLLSPDEALLSQDDAGSLGPYMDAESMDAVNANDYDVLDEEVSRLVGQAADYGQGDDSYLYARQGGGESEGGYPVVGPDTGFDPYNQTSYGSGGGGGGGGGYGPYDQGYYGGAQGGGYGQQPVAPQVACPDGQQAYMRSDGKWQCMGEQGDDEDQGDGGATTPGATTSKGGVFINPLVALKNMQKGQKMVDAMRAAARGARVQVTPSSGTVGSGVTMGGVGNGGCPSHMVLVGTSFGSTCMERSKAAAYVSSGQAQYLNACPGDTRLFLRRGTADGVQCRQVSKSPASDWAPYGGWDSGSTGQVFAMKAPGRPAMKVTSRLLTPAPGAGARQALPRATVRAVRPMFQPMAKPTPRMNAPAAKALARRTVMAATRGGVRR